MPSDAYVQQLHRIWDKKRSDIKQEGQKTLKFFKQLGAKDFVMPSDAYVQVVMQGLG